MNALYQAGGGYKTNAIFSGAVAPLLARSGSSNTVAGSDVLLQAGAGRLNAIIPHVSVLAMSGVAVNLYDAVTPVSGGPVPASGHIPLGGLVGAFGVSGQLTPANTPIPLNVPFYSGLCINSRLGQPGVTVVWTPEDFTKVV